MQATNKMMLLHSLRQIPRFNSQSHKNLMLLLLNSQTKRQFSSKVGSMKDRMRDSKDTRLAIIKQAILRMQQES